MDSLTHIERSKHMSRIRAKDTKPEWVVRKLIHGLGYRYRLHDRKLPGCPDLVFAGRRKVIFVHGCFWHRHTAPSCKLARLPKSRLDFWGPKLEGNRIRDMRNQKLLRHQGWDYLVLWECELDQLSLIISKVRTFLEEL